MPLSRDVVRNYYNPLDITAGNVMWFNMSGVNGRNVYQVINGVQSVKEVNINVDNNLFTPADYFKMSTQPKKIKVDIYFGSPGGIIRPFSGNNQPNYRIPVAGGSGAIGFIEDCIMAVRDDFGNPIVYSTNQGNGGDGGLTPLSLNYVARETAQPDYSEDQTTGVFIQNVDDYIIDNTVVPANTYLLGAGRGAFAATSVEGAWKGGKIVTNPASKSSGLLYGGYATLRSGLDSHNYGMTAWPQGNTIPRQAELILTTANYTNMNRVWLESALEFGKTQNLRANLTQGIIVRGNRSGIVIIYKDVAA